MSKNTFYYPYNPRIESICKRLVYGQISTNDLIEISKNFVLAGSRLLISRDSYETGSEIDYLEEEGVYITKITGFVSFDEKNIRIIPFVGVSKDNLFSYIIIPIAKLCQIELEEKIIRDNFFTFNFKDNLDDMAITEFLELHFSTGGVEVIHNGVKPIPNRHQDIELDKQFGLNIDHYRFFFGERILSINEINFFKKIKANQVIGKWQDTIPGQNGIDVFGNEILFKDINSYFKIGDNLIKDEDDNIVSKIDGVLRINCNGILSVRNTQIINEEVKTNLKVVSDEDVIITGRIFPNIIINIKGNIVIQGGVENIEIDCGGELLISGGVTGKASINVVGNSIIQYITNSKLISESNVQVNQYLMNSNVVAKKDIRVFYEQFGEIVGGLTNSKEGFVEASTLGSVSNLATTIMAGSEIKVQKKTNKYLEEKISKEILINNQKILKQSGLISNQYFRDARAYIKNLPSEDKKKLGQNLLKLKELRQRSIDLDKEMKAILLNRNKKVEEEFVYIKAYNEIYEGVVLEIRKINYLVKANKYVPLIFTKDKSLPDIMVSNFVLKDEK